MRRASEATIGHAAILDQPSVRQAVLMIGPLASRLAKRQQPSAGLRGELHHLAGAQIAAPRQQG